MPRLFLLVSSIDELNNSVIRASFLDIRLFSSSRTIWVRLAYCSRLLC